MHCIYWAQAPQPLKPPGSRIHAPQQGKPQQGETHAWLLESSPCSPLLEKVPVQQWRPSPAKNKWINLKKKKNSTHCQMSKTTYTHTKSSKHEISILLSYRKSSFVVKPCLIHRPGSPIPLTIWELSLCALETNNYFRINYFSLWQEQSSEMERLKIQIMVLTFGICVTLGQLLNLFEPQFPHL